MEDDSDSAVQRGLEPELIKKWAATVIGDGEILHGHRFRHSRPDGGVVTFEVDALLPGPPAMLVEVYSSLGKPRGGQQHKLKGDAFKLLAIERLFFEGLDVRKVLLVTSSGAEDWLTSEKAWVGLALQTLGIDVVRVPLTSDQRARLRPTREAQGRANIRRE